MIDTPGWAWVQQQESDSQPGTAAASDSARLAAVLQRCGVSAAPRDKAAFSDRNLQQDLGRLLQGGSTEQHRDVLDRQLTRPAIAGKPNFACESNFT